MDFHFCYGVLLGSSGITFPSDNTLLDLREWSQLLYPFQSLNDINPYLCYGQVKDGQILLIYFLMKSRSGLIVRSIA